MSKLNVRDEDPRVLARCDREINRNKKRACTKYREMRRNVARGIPDILLENSARRVVARLFYREFRAYLARLTDRRGMKIFGAHCSPRKGRLRN